MTLDTAGFTLSGFDRTSGSGNGGGIQAATNWTIFGALRGGNANGTGTGGQGFNGGFATQLINHGTITGGTGAGAGGGGGFGAVMSGAGSNHVNNGTITGGTGGTSASTAAGGSGGVGGSLVGGTLTNNGTITGGAGGANSAGATSGGGGSGVSMSGGTSLVNNGTITGGAGGASSAGTAGSGGVSVLMNGTSSLVNNGLIEGGASTNGAAGFGIAVVGIASVTNNGTIRGGQSGVPDAFAAGIFAGAGSLATFINNGTIEGGTGAAGISVNTVGGTDITIVNSGTIRAGAGHPNAIRLSTSATGLSVLELHAGSVIEGDVLANATGTNDTLRLGGAADSSFDASSIGAAAQYRSFDRFQKNGASTWTLTGTTTALTPWQVTGGTLSVASDGALGDAAGALTLDGGALQNTASFASARAVTLGAGGGTFRTDADLSLAGVVGGAGALTKTGAGTLVLSGANTYSGGTTISAGTLQLGSGGTSGSILGDVTNNGTLSFNRSDSLTFGGVISGSGAVSNAGPGTTVLTAANSYTGSTHIQAGTLALTGAGAIAASSGVAVDGSFDISGVSPAGTSVAGISSSGAVLLGAKQLTLTAASGDFGGVVSGTGGLQVAGGTQTLSGTNTYTGGTTISAGTLQLGNGGTSGSIVGDVTNNGTLSFNRSDAVTFAGVISGSGGVRQIGSGATRLTGNSAAFTGTTTVEAGMLAVNGTLGGTLNVLAAGRLQGTGTVGSTTVAGTIAPGNSIGTLTVNGNYTQAPGSTYEVEVDPGSNASDLIHATGTASIGSGARLNVVRINSGTYILGTRYTVLTADGGVAGTYSLGGDTTTAFVQLFDRYDANNVYLVAEKVRSIADAAGTPNQAAVGAALDSLPASNSLANAVTWLPNDFAARDALNQLSADIHASTKTALLEDSRFVREAAIDRLRGAACAPGSAVQQAPQQPGTGCTPEDRQKHAAWTQVFGSWGSIDSDGNAAKLERDIGGFMVGADTGVGAGWRVGALGGYSRASADTSARNSSSKTDSYHLGAYGGTQWGATALRLGASHSWNKTETNRSVAFAGFAGGLEAEYDSTTTQVFGELGHRIDLGRTTLEPFAGLAHVRLESDAFFERGGPAAMHGDGDSLDATFSTIGLRASLQASERIRVRGMLGWRHAFGDTTPASTHAFGGSLPFTLTGVPLAKDVAVLEAGIETQLRPNLTLGASYSGQFGDGLQDHGFKASLNWKF
ncbi:autotransporter outer membrane beta-barrel domain-containing protein [Variovorax sp. MHTC-1]|nr:autotransporter outer membrane beta-barrel domain-containing protein [Variovorax sp. MHTC-1]